MSRLSARFFAHVQSAAFYRELHQRAVNLLPAGEGKTWFDAGCGPGLVARLAAARGYRAQGFDIDPAMVREAHAIAESLCAPADFRVASVEQLAASGRCATVVSAASLLAVLDDKRDAIHRLLSCVEEGGTLLLIETTARMAPRTAWRWLRKNGFRDRNWVLLLWAWARGGRTAFGTGTPAIAGCRIEHADVFDGLVSAWLIRRESGNPRATEARRYGF